MKKKRQDVIVYVDVKKLMLFLMTAMMCVLAAVALFHTAKRFFKVGKFETSESSFYEEEDLINACGIRLGDRLYGLNTEEAEQRLLEACPFLEEAEVKFRFPGRLSIEVKDRQVPWYIEISGTKYALNEDLLVVDEVRDTAGMTRLILPHVKRVVSGSVPEFSESELELRKTLEVIAAIRSATFRKRLTEVNLESRWDIRLTVDETFVVFMGDMENFSVKLKAVKEILNSDRLSGAVSGEIHAENPSQGIAVSPNMGTSSESKDASKSSRP